MVKRASDGMVLRHGEGGAKIEGPALTKFMSQLKDYLDFFDKVEKRLHYTRSPKPSPRSLSRRAGTLPAVSTSNRHQPESTAPPGRTWSSRSSSAKLATSSSTRSTRPAPVPASLTRRARCAGSTPGRLASTVESRQLLAKHAQLREQLQPPFLIEYAAKTSKAEAEEEAGRLHRRGHRRRTAAPGTCAAEVKNPPSATARSRTTRSRRKRRAKSSSTSSNRARRSTRSSATRASAK